MFGICSSGLLTFLVLLSSHGLSQGEVDVNVALKNWRDHEGHVFVMNEIVVDLQRDLEDLISYSNNQFRILKEMRLESDVAPLAEVDVCERITISFNSTHRKYNMVEERIINKLDDIHEEQKTNLKQIMDKRNCNAAVVALTAATADVTPESVTSVKEKISSLEVELQKYENQQKRLQEKNEELLKMLKDVNTKLSSHQGEFEKFEKDLRSVVENVNKAVAKEKDSKQSTIPMGVVLALTQNQKKTK